MTAVMLVAGCGAGRPAAQQTTPVAPRPADGAAPPVVVNREVPVGGTDHPWHVNLSVSRDAGGAPDCGPALRRDLRLADDSAGSKHPFDQRSSPTSPVAPGSGDEVIVTDVGPVDGSPYEEYAVVRTGPAVTRVEALTGPGAVADGMAPKQGWAVVLFLASDRPRALRITSAGGATRQFFLRDAAGPCRPAPVQSATPDCAAGQYRVTASGSAGAGSLAVVAELEPVGVETCVLHADVTASLRYANGRSDGGPVTARVDWLLPQSVAWNAGADCFNHTEVLTVRTGSVEAHQRFPGGDCSTAVQGRQGSERHALTPMGG